MHYNTTNEYGDNIIKARNDALKQDQRVLAVFQAFSGRELSPWIVRAKMETNAPITSIRRAINTLSKDGKIKKTKTKLMGPFGKPSYCWKLSDEQS
tara:strand:- start:1912 stop:2199 length:288 start_codon:yes stop_codon:yes gene_type:complete